MYIYIYIYILFIYACIMQYNTIQMHIVHTLCMYLSLYTYIHIYIYIYMYIGGARRCGCGGAARRLHRRRRRGGAAKASRAGLLCVLVEGRRVARPIPQKALVRGGYSGERRRTPAPDVSEVEQIISTTPWRAGSGQGGVGRRLEVEVVGDAI